MKKLKKQVMLCGHKEFYYKSEKADDICVRCEKTLRRKTRRYYFAKQK
jgi:hypothetical protein